MYSRELGKMRRGPHFVRVDYPNVFNHFPTPCPLSEWDGLKLQDFDPYSLDTLASLGGVEKNSNDFLKNYYLNMQ